MFLFGQLRPYIKAQVICRQWEYEAAIDAQKRALEDEQMQAWFEEQDLHVSNWKF